MKRPWFTHWIFTNSPLPKSERDAGPAFTQVAPSCLGGLRLLELLGLPWLDIDLET